MKNDIVWHKIQGRFVYITELNFPLRDLCNYFPSVDLCYIFGKEASTKEYLDEIENDVWSKHLIFKLNHANKFAGYLRIIAVEDIVEVHGCGLNISFIDKIALSEAWFLLINKCFQVYNVNYIFTSCTIDNAKAYRFITGTGFIESSREEDENRINFKLSYFDFNNNSKKGIIDNNFNSKPPSC